MKQYSKPQIDIIRFNSESVMSVDPSNINTNKIIKNSEVNVLNLP